MVTYRLWPAFMAGLLLGFMQTSVNAEPARDYAIHAAVYQWYGKLDTGVLPTELLSSNAKIDLPEYNGALVPGAHHLLSLRQIGIEDDNYLVEIAAEFQPKGTDDKQQGHYLEARLYFTRAQLNTALMPTQRSNQPWRLSRLETLVHQIDDFDSRYRSASDANLIRALIFNWTAQLDSPASEMHVGHLIGTDSFRAAESTPKSAASYLAYLNTLGYQQSRREIKNLNLITDETAGRYRVNFEYQWRATNQAGESELSQIAVELRVQVADGRVEVQSYTERYLPPVTDLGAEIRC